MRLAKHCSNKELLRSPHLLVLGETHQNKSSPISPRRAERVAMWLPAVQARLPHAHSDHREVLPHGIERAVRQQIICQGSPMPCSSMAVEADRSGSLLARSAKH